MTIRHSQMVPGARPDEETRLHHSLAQIEVCTCLSPAPEAHLAKVHEDQIIHAGVAGVCSQPELDGPLANVDMLVGSFTRGSTARHVHRLARFDVDDFVPPFGR